MNESKIPILPDTIRWIAGITEPITRSNRGNLLPRYKAARLLLDSGLECLSDNPQERQCFNCAVSGLQNEQRLCERLKKLRPENQEYFGE